MADTAALRGAVYSVLSGNDDFESLPFSTLRMEVEKSIGLSHGSLKSHKSEIMDLVVEFKHTRKYKKAAPRESESSEGAKGGKYSKRETELIMNTVEEYMTANGLTREDLCPALRNGTGYKHHSILWSMLHEALPNRLAKDIKNHAVLQLSASLRKGKWKPEEKILLKSLVDKHGQKWCDIGRALNRFSIDCKDAYKILVPREKTGKFTEEEDSRLIGAIREVCECPDTLPKELMPSKGISWKAVALAMKDERLPLDYNRRWMGLRAKLFGRKRSHGRVLDDDAPDIVVNTTPAEFKDRQILAYLSKLEPEDDSDVTWASLDREFAYSRGLARRRWCDMVNAAAFPKGMNMATCIEKLLEARGMTKVEVAALESTGTPIVSYSISTPRIKKKKNARNKEDGDGGGDDDDDGAEEEVYEVVRPKRKRSKKKARPAEDEQEQEEEEESMELVRALTANDDVEVEEDKEEEEGNVGDIEEVQMKEDDARRSDESKKEKKLKKKKSKSKSKSKSSAKEEEDEEEESREERKKKKRKHRHDDNEEEQGGAEGEEGRRKKHRHKRPKDKKSKNKTVE